MPRSACPLNIAVIVAATTSAARFAARRTRGDGHGSGHTNELVGVFRHMTCATFPLNILCACIKNTYTCKQTRRTTMFVLFALFVCVSAIVLRTTLKCLFGSNLDTYKQQTVYLLLCSAFYLDVCERNDEQRLSTLPPPPPPRHHTVRI